MKKFLVITVLALFLALPVLAVSNSDFTANDNVTITLRLNGTESGTQASLMIKNGSEARKLTVNANGTLDKTFCKITSVKRRFFPNPRTFRPAIVPAF